MFARRQYKGDFSIGKKNSESVAVETLQPIDAAARNDANGAGR
jgi:hypothetical protein